MLADVRVAPVHRLAQRVGREAHRMLGFVRFREVREGFYYAPLEPDHHVLPLIASHFADRFSDQHWVIHDLRRGRGIVHDANRREWLLTGLALCAGPEFSARELDFQELVEAVATVDLMHEPRFVFGAERPIRDRSLPRIRCRR